MGTGTTNIVVSEENWARLNRLKRPGESFDDVIHRLFDEEITTE